MESDIPDGIGSMPNIYCSLNTIWFRVFPNTFLYIKNIFFFRNQKKLQFLYFQTILFQNKTYTLANTKPNLIMNTWNYELISH